MRHARPAVVLATLMLGGCAVSSYCEGDQDYENAASVPAIQSSDGLQVKESSTALKIPPEPETKVPYDEKVVDAKGKEVVRCLDQPPALVLPDPKPAAAEPAVLPEPPAKAEEPAAPPKK